MSLTSCCFKANKAAQGVLSLDYKLRYSQVQAKQRLL